jgi:hypothetical protein
MFIDRNDFEVWMNRLMERFDGLEKRLPKPPEKERHTFQGERLLDNQDLCFMLNVSKRTLQRYRSRGWLPAKRIEQKTWYTEPDVQRFIEQHLRVIKYNSNKKKQT